MEADSFPIAKVFSNGGDIHFRLPYFQREYAWEMENWQTLLNDILDLYNLYQEKKPPEHFMGSLVVINEGMNHGTVPIFKLVDGQQRLTTITLILCALAEIVKSSQPEKYNKIRKYFTNPDETGELKYKLLPTTKYNDRSAYLAILDGKSSSLSPNGSRILPAYNYYLTELLKRIKSGELNADQLFLVIINCLQVVFINLNNGEKPYQIFESLNAKSKPLTQADLVRNYIAMKLPEADQKDVFENHWSIIEELLQEKRFVGRSRLGELTAFIRHYLAFRSGVLCNEKHVYARFRDRIEVDFNTADGFENEIITLENFARHYDGLLRPENEKNPDIRNELERLNILEFSTGYPFILAMIDAYDENKIDRNQFLDGLKLLENYLVRRYLIDELSKDLNKVFTSLWKDIDLGDFIPSLKKALLEHNYPADYAIRQRAQSTRLYDTSGGTRAKTIMVLETINQHLSLKDNRGGYTVLNGTPTIEHILPQRPSDQWKIDLGENFNQIYDQYLHTLGNLTLVTAGWNSDLSNLPFSQKKSKLDDHALLLNSSYFKRPIAHWNEKSILDRAEFLVNNILDIWPAIGDIPAPKSVTGKKPIKLTILGQQFPVTTWRDVAEQTTEEIIHLVDDFDDIAKTMPSYLAHKSFNTASRKLSNGWYLSVNLSANVIKGYCRAIIVKAGLSITDWQVDEM
jgi:uncharacterized protein with ParB-like and HNH nuclease domain